jgi:23S rRNA (pseudouridine1915-N3)-methyltransferase
MRLMIIAIGRLKAGPERELVTRYVDRLNTAGRTVAIGPVEHIEIDESRARRAEDRKAEEANAMLRAAAGARLVILDESGRTETSEAFATRLGKWRDDGAPSVAFAIGGPDGHGEAIRQASTASLSFGSMTMPHQIVRALVTEQLYRAVTILTGHPYHRA